MFTSVWYFDELTDFVIIQINDMVSIVSIDRTDGCQVFFPDGIGNREIVTAKSSEMNIMIPKPGGEDMVSGSQL